MISFNDYLYQGEEIQSVHRQINEHRNKNDQDEQGNEQPHRCLLDAMPAAFLLLSRFLIRLLIRFLASFSFFLFLGHEWSCL